MLGTSGVAWPSLLARLRELVDLEGSARACGALRRRRGVADAGVLLRLALVYGGTKLSLRGTAAWAAAAGVAELSDVALLYRLQGAEGWLGWLVRELLSKELAALAAGVPAAGGWRVRLVDGTGIGLAGPGGKALFRLHAAFDLAARRFDALELTPGSEAESLARVTAGPGEVLVADRFYAKARGVHAVVAQGGHVVTRRGLTACRLLGTDGQKLAGKAILALARAQPTLDLPVLVPAPGGAVADPLPARLIIRRKPVAAAERARARAVRKAARQGYAARPKQMEAASYFMLMTTLPPEAMAADAVCALYRLRWQIELAFKRLKSLMGLEEIDARDHRLAKAAVCAKLILAILAESLIGRVLALSPTA
ncbi:MAG: transposase [Geminicoccaceae bacterium]